jgi:hypothetical protein
MKNEENTRENPRLQGKTQQKEHAKENKTKDIKIMQKNTR